MIEEKVIQQESVTSEEQPVATPETPKAPTAPKVPTVPLAEFEALKQQLAEKEKAFQNAKSKIGEYYDDRKKALEDQLGSNALEKFDQSAKDNMNDMNNYSTILYNNFKKLL